MGNAQEWFTNIDVAGRLALVQNKMLFVVWEESFNGSIPVLVNSDAGDTVVIDLANDTSLDSIIKAYFIPVRLPEANYESFINTAEGRGYKYINKLTDNNIKIMDVNGNILNTETSMAVITDFSKLIDTYALNTAFLNNALQNYSQNKSYLTSYLLAEKYMEFAIYAKKDVREEIMDLSTIYLKESAKFVTNTSIENSAAILQKIELTRIAQNLILNRQGKARRQLNRMKVDEIDPMNERLYGFLQFTTHMLRNDIEEAEPWKSKISSLDLRKTEMILAISRL